MKIDLNNFRLDAVKGLFQNIWQDLRNKNLLPVAIGLLAALIVVPVVVARTGGDSDSGSTTSAVVVDLEKGEVAAEAAAKADPVQASDNRPDGQDVGGDPTNPFNQPQPKGSATDTTATTPAGDSSGAPTTTTGDSGSGSGTGKSDSGKNSGPDTAYEIDVRFGLAGETKSKKNVAALSPFPSADDAYFVYLGAVDGGKTAVFLVSTDVKVTGDGICSPSETNCKQVELRVGDTELFDVTDTATGAALGSYELELVKIHR